MGTGTGLSGELYWLTLTILLSSALWVPYIVNRFWELGPPSFTWFPPATSPAKAAWAERAIMAHRNAMENLMIFAPLAIMINLTKSGNAVTELACMIYFYARCGHYLICIFGFPIVVRTLVFLAGVSCQITLIVSLLTGHQG